MGFWSENLTGDSTHFSTSQCPLEICGRDGNVTPISFTYHRDPLGIRFELVDVAIKPMMEDSLFKPT